MRFSAAASAIVAFAATALAQTEGFNPINTPNKDEVLPAGSPYEITWEVPKDYSDKKVSISLIGGDDPNTLVPIADIAAGVSNNAGSYEWTVDASLGEAKTYGLVMKLESDESVYQYSKPFHIKAGGDEGKEENKGKPTKTVTTATGIKTVTLTSCESSTSTTPVITTSALNTTTPIWSTSTIKHNTTSSIISKPTLLPPAPTTEEPTPAPEPTQSEPVEVPTPVPGAGAHLVAGPAALIGGLAVALLAL